MKVAFREWPPLMSLFVLNAFGHLATAGGVFFEMTKYAAAVRILERSDLENGTVAPGATVV